MPEVVRVVSSPAFSGRHSRNRTPVDKEQKNIKTPAVLTIKKYVYEITSHQRQRNLEKGRFVKTNNA